MTRSTEQRIGDILAAIERCERYAESLDSMYPDLAEMAEDAIERNLQIIGEATKYLDQGFIDAHPEIPWPQIRGFRNVLVHEYFGVDIDTISEIIGTHLPALASALQGSGS